MPARSTIKTAAKWIALACVAGLMVATAYSTTHYSCCSFTRTLDGYLLQGQFGLSYHPPDPPACFATNQPFALYIGFAWREDSGYWSFAAPTWVPMLPTIFAAAALRRRELSMLSTQVLGSRPRVRTAAKWLGAIASLSLVTIWLGSAWYGAGIWTPRMDVIVAGGCIRFTGSAPPDGESWGSWSGYGLSPFYLETSWGTSNGYPDIIIPLWPLCAVAVIATALVWRLDSAARRCRDGECPKCRYDRAGLALHAVCPECGTAGPG